MRILLLVTFILFQVYAIQSQTSLKEINLKQGKYKVGFHHYTLIDSTRTYQIKNEFNNRFIYRPIPVSIWYPTKTDYNNLEQLTVLDYLEVLKEEEEYKNLPNYFLLDWFHYLWNTPENQAHLLEKVHAVSNPVFLEGKFPVLIYASSYQNSSIENFALFEFLVSHGFVVISSPSRGTATRWLEGGNTKDMETQSRDIEILLKEINKYKIVDRNKIALGGFSFGGLSNAITVMKNMPIKALVSLDGTERYNYPVLEKSPYFDLDAFDIPYIHMAQKEIPEEVIISEKIPAELNYEFQLYDSLRNSNVYRYKFHDLTHSYFSSFGVLFANRDKRQDKSDAEIMVSYRLLSEHTLQFLKATLKEDKNAMQFLENSPEENGFPKNLISKKMKKSHERTFDYKDFNDVAARNNYKDLIPLYVKTKEEHQSLQLEEGMLNTLGLRLSFDPKKFKQGIDVLLLAVHIYPKSANLYDSLAEAYLYNKDIQNAINSFKKSLVLNPENQNAIDKIKDLDQ